VVADRFNVRFGSLADIEARRRNVRFTPDIATDQRNVRFIPETGAELCTVGIVIAILAGRPSHSPGASRFAVPCC
jgi:hypothetical protein